MVPRGTHGPVESRPAPWRALPAIAAMVAALLASACGPMKVVRVIDGREVVGRFVSARAYAMYARGAEAEARGELENARVEYLAAAEDDDSAEIWTRIGAVSCALGRADDAKSAFARAADRAPDYEPLRRERAACALASTGPARDAEAAFADAEAALALDPDHEETVLLYARAAETAGHPEQAEKALRELVARSPTRVAGWHAFHAFATRRGDPAAAARAAAALRDLGAPLAEPSPAAATGSTATGSTATLADVDAALARDALDEARAAAKRARLPPAELAVRAAALGRAALAKKQAELVFLADPASASAAVALAVACDLLRDPAGVAKPFADASALTTPLSPLARLLFAELLARRADPDAARAFLGPLPSPPAPDAADALLRDVTARVTARLRP